MGRFLVPAPSMVAIGPAYEPKQPTSRVPPTAPRPPAIRTSSNAATIFLAVGVLVGPTIQIQAAETGLFPNGITRVVFLGDSITHNGRYIDYVEAYHATRFPDARVELLNLGLSSETTSGLSEPGHANGQFPRPTLHERLTRVLEKTKPAMFVACYGMNDGIYLPFDEDRFAKYREGMERLVHQVQAAGGKIILLTPPVFDSPTDPYHDVLTKYSAWLLSRRPQGWQVFDVNGPMDRHLRAARESLPGYLLAKDHVHPNAFGHWLIAQSLLAGLQAPSDVETAEIDAAAGKVVHGQVAELNIESNQLRFQWRTRRAMPMDPQWDAKAVQMEKVVDRFNRHRLVVRGGSAARYRLYEGETLLAALPTAELAAGLDMLHFPALTTNRFGEELLKLIRKRQAMLNAAWLSETGHQRPGVARGLPLSEANRQAEELADKIRQLASPVTLHLRLIAEGNP